jgi:hypothetical protein
MIGCTIFIQYENIYTLLNEVSIMYFGEVFLKGLFKYRNDFIKKKRFLYCFGDKKNKKCIFIINL